MNGRITNRPAGGQTRLSLPRVGFVKVGYKDERGLPRSTDYFIPAGKYAALFTKIYGDKPQTIQVVFPSDDAAQVCNERYVYRDNDGRLIATGDGETFKVWNGKEYQELTVTDCPNLMKSVEKRYPNRQYQRMGDGWNVTLTLNFIIPLVRGIAGVWQFSTNGTASTIPQIRDVFDSMLEAKGYIKGIIFDLNVQYATSQKPGNKSRYPVVSLVPNESEENVKRVKEAYQPTLPKEKTENILPG